MAGLCAICGANMPDGAHFCPACGAAPHGPYTPPPAKKKSRAGVIIAVVCGIAAGGIILFAAGMGVVVFLINQLEKGRPADLLPPPPWQEARPPDNDHPADSADPLDGRPGEPGDPPPGGGEIPPDGGGARDTDAVNIMEKDWYFEVYVTDAREGGDIPPEYEGWAEDMMHTTTMYTAKHTPFDESSGQALLYLAYTEVFAPVVMNYSLDGDTLEYVYKSYEYGVETSIRGVIKQRADGNYDFEGVYALRYTDFDLSAEGTVTGHSLDQPLF